MISVYLHNIIKPGYFVAVAIHTVPGVQQLHI